MEVVIDIYLSINNGMTLKDITRSQQPFWGKCPIPRTSMKKSPLWRFFAVFELTENMTIDQDQSLQHLASGFLNRYHPNCWLQRYSHSQQSGYQVRKKTHPTTILHWEPKISTPNLSEYNSHCKGIPQAGSLHHLYLESSEVRNYALHYYKLTAI